MIIANDIDAHRVAPKLWVGSYPQSPNVPSFFDTVVLCAVELQEVDYSMHIVKAPFDDSKLSPREIKTAVSAAKTVHALRQRGKRVLVTCAQGVNRSAFVAAMALMLEGHSAQSAIHTIREHRRPPIGLTPLFNRHFQTLLHHFDRPGRRGPARHTPISAV